MLSSQKILAALHTQAFKTTWGLKVPGSERGQIIGRLANLVERHADTLAALEALNIGKSILELHNRTVS
jgi:aldehyde dehydrogenase (NAD+)